MIINEKPRYFRFPASRLTLVDSKPNRFTNNERNDRKRRPRQSDNADQFGLSKTKLAKIIGVDSLFLNAKNEVKKYQADNDILLPSWVGIAFTQVCLEKYMEKNRNNLEAWKRKWLFRPVFQPCIYFYVELKIGESSYVCNEYLYFKQMFQPFTSYPVRLSDICLFYDKFGIFNGSAIVRTSEQVESIKYIIFKFLSDYPGVRIISPTEKKSFLIGKLFETEDSKHYRALVKNLPQYCSMDCLRRYILQDISPKEIVKVNEQAWIFIMRSTREMKKLFFYNGETFDNESPPISIEHIDESKANGLLETFEVPDILDLEREKARNGIFLSMKRGLGKSRNDIPIPERLKLKLY